MWDLRAGRLHRELHRGKLIVVAVDNRGACTGHLLPNGVGCAVRLEFGIGPPLHLLSERSDLANQGKDEVARGVEERPIPRISELPNLPRQFLKRHLDPLVTRAGGILAS